MTKYLYSAGGILLAGSLFAAIHFSFETRRGIGYAAGPVAGQKTILAKEGAQPHIAIGRNRRAAVTYGLKHSIYCAMAKDGGSTFATPVLVTNHEGLMLGRRRGPRIAVTDDYIIISAISRNDGNLVTWRSADGGRTWTGPLRINDQDTSAREGLHAMCTRTKNDVFAVWLDLRDRKTKLYGAHSTDGGGSWSKNVLIYESPDGAICECCHPSVVADGDGNLYVMWRNNLQGARDMYLTTSKDGGRHFSAAEKLGAGAWPLKACPMDGGGLAVRGGCAVTVWRRDRMLYRTVPHQKEEALMEGLQPVIAIGPNGPYILWQNEGGIMGLLPSAAKPALLGSGAFPSIAGAPDGGSPVIAVWESADGVVASPLEP